MRRQRIQVYVKPNGMMHIICPATRGKMMLRSCLNCQHCYMRTDGYVLCEYSKHKHDQRYKFVHV